MARAEQSPALKAGRPEEQLKDVWSTDTDKGGNAVPYHLEDPFLRAEYEQTLAPEGLASRMLLSFYEPGRAIDADASGRSGYSTAKQ